jgi:hypothetical protein
MYKSGRLRRGFARKEQFALVRKAFSYYPRSHCAHLSLVVERSRGSGPHRDHVLPVACHLCRSAQRICLRGW